MSTRLWEQVRDWILLAALLAISLYVMFTQNDPLVRALRANALSMTANVESTFAWMGRYFRALEENSELRQHNIQLSSEVARSREARIQNTHLRRMLGLRDSLGYSLRAARVVAKDITRQNNLLTLDVGRADSVAVDMPVVNEQGIIGKVVLVSEHYARVMPYLNTDFRVPAKVIPIEAEGIVRWEGRNSGRLLMEHVIKTEPVKPGQLVVTSGHSGIFPPGRAIGRVDSLARQPGRNELQMYLSPAAPINEVDHVFVILRRPPDEQVALETEALR
jgi:rod shape-determining protein MreC